MLISEENLYNDAAARVEDTMIALPLDIVLNKFLKTSEKLCENCLMCCFNNIINKQTNKCYLANGRLSFRFMFVLATLSTHSACIYHW